MTDYIFLRKYQKRKDPFFELTSEEKKRLKYYYDYREVKNLDDALYSFYKMQKKIMKGVDGFNFYKDTRTLKQRKKNYLPMLLEILESYKIPAKDSQSNASKKRFAVLLHFLLTYGTKYYDFGFSPHKQLKRYNKFSNEYRSIFRALKEYDESIALYTRYSTSGSTDLDRDNNHTVLSYDKFAQLEAAINTVYKIYYDEIRSLQCVPQISHPPETDARLLGNCIAKGWLMPLAHIILVRDAQYQMMGELKYKKEELLKRNSKEFLLPCDNRILSHILDTLTQKCANSIREELAEYLKDQMFVYPIRELKDILKSKEAEEKAAIKEEQNKDSSSAAPLWPDFHQIIFGAKSDYHCNESSQIYAGESIPFPFLSYNIRSFFADFAATEMLDYKTTTTLLNVYPDALSNHDLPEEDVFNDNNTSNCDTPKDLNEALKILRSTLKSIASPEYYYGYKLAGKKDDIYSQQKKYAKVAFDKLISVKSSAKKDAYLWHSAHKKDEGKKSEKLKTDITTIKGILDYLNVRDPTLLGLICSNAVTINPEQIKIPTLFSMCRKKVMKQLERYGNSKKYYDAFHLELPKKALKLTKAYIKPITDQYVYSLTEAGAIEFIKTCVIAENLTLDTIKKTLCSIYKPVMDKDPAYKFFTEFHFLYLCIQTKKRALQLIANNAIATLITLSLD